MSRNALMLVFLTGMLIVGAKLSRSAVETTKEHHHSSGDYRHSRYEGQESAIPLDQCGGHLDINAGWYHYHEMPRC